MFGVPGRVLVDEIERMLDELGVEDWELSTKLETYLVENGDDLLEQWREIKAGNESKREKVNLLLDEIESEIFEKRELLEKQLEDFNEIEGELERLIEWEDEDGFEE